MFDRGVLEIIIICGIFFYAFCGFLVIKMDKEISKGQKIFTVIWSILSVGVAVACIYYRPLIYLVCEVVFYFVFITGALYWSAKILSIMVKFWNKLYVWAVQ